MGLACAPDEARAQPPAADLLDVPADMSDGLSTQPPRLPGAKPFEVAQFGNHIVVSDRP